MLKPGKISLMLMTALLLLSNFGFAFTKEICEMSNMSSCECGSTMRSNHEISGTQSLDSKSCCTQETKIFANSSEFETLKNHRTDFTVDLIPVQKPVIFTEPLFENNQINPVLVFYSYHKDIPVINSSLLI